MTTLSGLGTRRKRRVRFSILPVISILLILAGVGLFVLELVQFTQRDNGLPPGVSITGIPVGGLTAAEAGARIEEAFVQPVTLWYGDSPIILDPAAVGFRISTASMIAEARSAGGANTFWYRFFSYLTGQEVENTINIPLSADYQASLLDQFLQDISQRYDQGSGNVGYDLQTLTIRPGGSGTALNIDAARDLVNDALLQPNNRSVTLPIGETTAGQSADLSVLRDMIIAYLDSEGFIYDGQTTVASVYIMDLQTGEEINLLGDVAMSAASTIKLPILIDYYRYLSLAPTDEEAYLMANSLLCSNNASSNLIMQIIGGGQDIFAGIANVTETAQYLGATNTYISAPFDLGVEGQVVGSIPAPQTSPNPDFNTSPDPFNQTTAEDLGTLFNLVYDCANYGSGLMAAFPDGEFTQNECRQMLELMSGNDLGRLLQGGLPPDAYISHKNGWLQNVHGDAGIVRPPNGRDYIVSIFVWEDTDFFSFTEAWPLIEGISRAAWNYFSPETPLVAQRNDLRQEGAADCADFLPPFGEVDLNDIDGYRNSGT